MQIKTEDLALRSIPIDGVEPTLANLESGRYPYSKVLHFVISDKPSPATNGFAKFLSSEEAAPLMRESGILPAGQ